jgi:hypothetical protein
MKFAQRAANTTSSTQFRVQTDEGESKVRLWRLYAARLIEWAEKTRGRPATGETRGGRPTNRDAARGETRGGRPSDGNPVRGETGRRSERDSASAETPGRRRTERDSERRSSDRDSARAETSKRSDRDSERVETRRRLTRGKRPSDRNSDTFRTPVDPRVAPPSRKRSRAERNRVSIRRRRRP